MVIGRTALKGSREARVSIGQKVHYMGGSGARVACWCPLIGRARRAREKVARSLAKTMMNMSTNETKLDVFSSLS